jgi:adenine-specific DNA-methyltransferase
MSLRIGRLPSRGVDRETLRSTGQFWTPDWVARAMVSYVTTGPETHLFDPSVGAGAFFRAAKNLAAEQGTALVLSGMEIDPSTLKEARTQGLAEDDLRQVRRGDFLFDPPLHKLSAIVANPPYIRHHRLSQDTKQKLKELACRLTGRALDGRTGYHAYFLLRALDLLMPADTCEGIYARDLWRWISREYRLDAVVTFEPEATPFPQVDTNPIILFIRKEPPPVDFYWARCRCAGTGDLATWVASGFTGAAYVDLDVHRRSLAEGLATGLSREPVLECSEGFVLSDYALVRRGVATGANEFFFLTKSQAEAYDIPEEFLVNAVGRTRDISGAEITASTMCALDARGRPTKLLYLDGRSPSEFPKSVRDYLYRGEKSGLPQRPLIRLRRPWYKMERRKPPEFLFAYLGRRNTRFIRNRAGVIPLTGFLCVYPRETKPAFVDRLWQVLNDPRTVANLRLVGKSYGDGAIKVEPRALERLPLSPEVLQHAGLQHGPSLGQCAFAMDE